MLAFWLGSLPVMTGLGVALELMSSTLKRRLPRISAAVLIGAGFATLVMRVDAAALVNELGPHAASAHPPGCPFHSGARISSPSSTSRSPSR
jgi:sulfite exporter TauE/SafE